MLLILLVIFYAVLDGVRCKCVCADKATPGALIYVNSAYDDKTFAACRPDIGFCVTNVSNSDQNGFDKFIFSKPFSQSITLILTDGGVQKKIDASNYDTILRNYQSFTNTLILNFTYQDNYDNELVSMSFRKADGFATTLLTTIITTASTTTPAPISDFPINPYYVNTDLAVAIAVSQNKANDNQVFAMLQRLVGYMDVVAFQNETTGSRLALQVLSSVPVDGVISSWGTTASQFQNYIDNMTVVLAHTPIWNSALLAFLDDGRLFDATKVYGSRQNAMKVYAIFTSVDFADDVVDVTSTLGYLVKRDVHMVIVTYGNATSLPKIDQLKQSEIPNLAVYHYNGSDTEFINTYITNGDRDTAFGCSPASLQYAISSGKPSGKIYFPPNKNKFSVLQYCNQQNVQLQFTGDAKVNALCFSIDKFDLEVEKDWLRLYDSSGAEIIALTGSDGNSQKITISTPNATAVFQTNSNFIKSGISFSVEAGPCTTYF